MKISKMNKQNITKELSVIRKSTQKKMFKESFNQNMIEKLEYYHEMGTPKWKFGVYKEKIKPYFIPNRNI